MMITSHPKHPALTWLLCIAFTSTMLVARTFANDDGKQKPPSEENQAIGQVLHALWLQSTVSSEAALVEEARRRFPQSLTNEASLVLIEKLGQGGIDAATFLAGVTVSPEDASPESSYAGHLLDAAKKQSAENARLHLDLLRAVYGGIGEDIPSNDAAALWSVGSYLSQKRPVGRGVWDADATELAVVMTRSVTFRLYQSAQGGYLSAQLVPTPQAEPLVFRVLPSEMSFLSRALATLGSSGQRQDVRSAK